MRFSHAPITRLRAYLRRPRSPKSKKSSLRIQLTLVFTGFVAIAIFFALLTLWQQHRLAAKGVDLAIKQTVELEASMRLQSIVGSVERIGSRDESTAPRFEEARGAIRDLKDHMTTPGEAEILSRVKSALERYAIEIDSSRPPYRSESIRIAYGEVSAAISALVELKRTQAYRTAHALAIEQDRFARYSFIGLLLFVLIMSFAAMRMINVVTEPLVEFCRTLDEFNLEEDLPSEMPHLTGRAIEVERLSQSFGQLIERLRAYRTVNLKRLLIEKRRADVIAASISDGVFLLRGDEILYVNPVGERILALSPGRTWKGLSLATVEESDSPGLRTIANALKQSIPLDLEVELDLEKGRKLYYLVQSYPVNEKAVEQIADLTAYGDAGSNLLERWQADVLVVARDVTLVRESQEAKSHFLATLSHEVKTPVTSLTMATRLLRRSVDEFEKPLHRSLIKTCADDVDRLRGLIDELLSVSSFDTLTQKLEIKRVNVFKLVKQAIQFFQPEAFQRGVTLALQTRDENLRPILPVDATKISWALSNLMTNALRHAPRGGKVEITAECVLQEGAANFIQVRIRDNGPGIDRTRHDRIFDRFNPFYDLRVARTGSVGMGLAIAREIIVSHGGRIWITSEPGEGAEFCFTLPMEQEDRKKQAGKDLDEEVESNVTKGEESGAIARC